MRAQERQGKERRGGKKGPRQSSRNTLGKHDKTRGTESLSFPPSLAHLCHIEADKKARRTGAQKEAHLCLPSFCSFIPSLSHCCQKRRSKEKRRREERNEEGFGEGGGTPFSYLYLPILFIFPAVPSITWTCEKATRGQDQGGDSLLCYFIVVSFFLKNRKAPSDLFPRMSEFAKP